MKSLLSKIVAGLSATVLCASAAQATVVLYDQNFENPVGFVNDGGDLNVFKPVNNLYGNQPPGFAFAQAFTVETILITGTQAFGTGYSDPSGKGGNYAIGMQTAVQNDLLGLAFNVGTNDFLNVRLDMSSIDVSVFGGPVVPAGAVPTFEFTLFDNPSGATGLGSGTPLSTLQASGTASARNVFDWTEILLPLDASNATNGNVILRIDLLSGGYAALDNFRIAASNTKGDVGDPTTSVPEPGSLTLLGIGAIGMAMGMKQRRKQAA